MAQSIEQIGKYRIVRRLGGGGMAEVFSARLLGVEGFARPVAIKRVLPGYAQDGSFASMFIREAQLSARFHHPNVVSVVDFDRDPEHGLFLAMELVEGRDLNDLMHTGILPIPVVIHLVAEILRGLGYAHNLPPDDSGVRGVVHRDVSPHNVLLSWEGAVKVSDFGIAKARGAATSASASVMIKGKPAYMSPEQANGAKLDGRSDLFAVGVMLWEMLVGRTLFAGSGTMNEMFAALFFMPIPSPHDVRPEVPEDLSAVALRLLARPREQRYATAEEAVEAILACDSAPRNGRAELIETLAERFPEHAPRSRQLAAAVAAPTPEMLAIASAATQIARDGASNEPLVPVAAERPGRRHRAWLLGAFAGAGVIAAGLTLGLARFMSSGSAATTAPTARAAPDALAASASESPQPTPPVAAKAAAVGPAAMTRPLESPAAPDERPSSSGLPPTSTAGAPVGENPRSAAGHKPLTKRATAAIPKAPQAARPTGVGDVGEPSAGTPRPLTEAPNLLQRSEP